MDMRFLVIGKPTMEYAQLLREYEKRLNKYCTFTVLEVKNEKELEAKVKGYVVVLDQRGKQCSSEELAQVICNQKSMTIIVGGSEGLSAQMVAKAQLVVSFSKMTFPHQLARLMLTEQVYRAFTILKKEPYHK